ncbi:MAG: type II toxin-antitoxin system RelE/ParE family toxin [Chloroflexi bacterium]|nr:type II toxin-antitoxin system RelE/ParE family toxin [Chloroflexota bacterium]
MAYNVKLTPHAAKQFADLPAAVKPRIGEAMRKLADDPRPPGCKRLRNRRDWRIRVGDYRIVYLVDDAAKVVFVTWIGPRSSAYR